MAVESWEEVLGIFTDSKSPPVSRADVTKLQWIANSHVDPWHFEWGPEVGPPGGYEFGWNKPWKLNNFWPVNYQVGFNISPDLKDPLPQDKPVYQWHFHARDILGDALASGSSVFSLYSFDDVSNTIKGVQRYLDTWFQTVKGWADGIDVPDSEMQGSAAGQFRSMLIGVANQFADLHTQMINPSDPSKEVDDARTAAMVQLQNLYHVMYAYGTEHNAWPAQILGDLFHEEFGEGSYTFNNGWLTTKTLGDPNAAGFWAAFEQKAKNRWLDQVAASLDQPATDARGKIVDAYGKAKEALLLLRKPTWDAPASPGKGGLNGDSTTSDAIADLLKGLTNPKGDANDLPGGGGSGDETELPDSEGAGSFSGDGDGSSFEQNGSEGEGQGPGSALEDQLKNPNAEGPGSFGTNNITGNGDTGIGGSDQNTTGPGTFGPGSLTNLPPGSTINKNGTVTGPDGKILKNPDGSVYKAPPGAFQRQQKQQETLRRQAEAEQKAYQQQAKEQEEAQRRAEQQRRDNEKALARLRESSRLSSDHSGLRTNGEGGTQQSKGVFKVRNADGTFSEYTSGKGGRNSIGIEPTGRVRTTSVDPSTKAVEEATGTGRRTSSQSPMMPPGAGAGAGAGSGQEQHRERKSYLDEDEETWGTQECTTTGVIG
ncbi:MAP7 domain-containing protein [Streptomyces sp. NPDC002403]